MRTKREYKAARMRRYESESKHVKAPPETAEPSMRVVHAFGEFLELAGREPEWVKTDTSGTVGAIKCTKNGQRKDFCGVSDYSEALAMARNGWAEGLAKVNAVKDKIVCALEGMQVPRVDFVCADEGVEFDVGRWVERESECWLAESRSEQTSKGRKIVRVVVSFSIHCDVSPEDIINRGAAIMAAIELLIARGFSVGVEVDFSVERHGNYSSSRIMLKEQGELMEPDRMAFALVHPAMLRCLFFTVCEHQGREKFFAYWDSNYGYCREAYDNRGDLYFDANSINHSAAFRDEGSAASSINALLNQLNANTNQEPT